MSVESLARTSLDAPIFQHLQVDLDEPGYLQEMKHKLNRYGFATFEGMNLTEQLVTMSCNFGDIILHRDADEYGITRITPQEVDTNLPSSLGFTDQELRLHTDGTAVRNPAKFLALYCNIPAQEGGMTMLLDGKKLYIALEREYPELLQKLLTRDSAIFGNPLGEHHVGSVFSKGEDSVIMMRFRSDSGGYYSTPLAGDIEELTEIMDRLALKFDLKKGQGYMVNNNRALHARTSFTGHREIYRVLIAESPSSQIGNQIKKGFVI